MQLMYAVNCSRRFVSAHMSLPVCTRSKRPQQHAGIRLTVCLKYLSGLFRFTCTCPEHTGCSLRISEKKFSGGSRNEPVNSFEVAVTVKGRKEGLLQAFHTSGHPASGTEPFTPEEQHLISMVASWTGNRIEARQTTPLPSESDNRLAQIVQSNPIATFVIDARHRTTHWNRACENLTGVKAADVIGTGMHWKAFMPRRSRCWLISWSTRPRNKKL